MKKTDTIISVVIGFLIGVFFFIIIKNIEIEIPYTWLLLIVFPPLTLFGLFVASIIGKKVLALYQMAKFVLVGALNTIVDMGILNFLMWRFEIYGGGLYPIFVGISFLVATVNSYFWNKHWTFTQRKETFAPGEYLKFLIILIGGLLLHMIIASFVVNVIGPQFGISVKLWANIGKFIAVLIAFVWNFFGAKFIVFKK